MKSPIKTLSKRKLLKEVRIFPNGKTYEVIWMEKEVLGKFICYEFVSIKEIV